MLKSINPPISKLPVMKFFALTSLLLVHFSSQSQEKDYSFTETYKVTQPAQLAIASSDGNITVLPSEQNAIVVQYIVRRNNTLLQMNRAELEKEVTLTVTPGANSLKIQVKYPATSGIFNSINRVNVNFRVYVPKQTACDLRTSDGNVSVNGLVSNQLVQTSDGNIAFADVKGSVKGGTSDGNITVRGITGQVTLNTSDGNISLTDISGNVSSNTSDGNVKATKVRGDLSLRTSDGHIEFSGIAGSVAAVTSDGNISGNIVELQKKLSLISSEGNITVSVPPRLGLNLDLKGSSVHTQLTNFSGTSKKNAIVGKINGGGIPVELKVSDGNVVLEYK